jgi:parallel beta-helix repeat protein
MKKTMIIVVISILLLSVFTVFLSVDTCTASGNTLYVGGNGSGNYTTIQGAVNDASDGNTIYVYSGTYNENVFIDKPLLLMGSYSTSRPVINGQDTHKSTIEIMSNDVTVSGFEIHNTIGQSAGYYGIAVGKTQSQLGTFSYVTITDCHITDTYHGILLRGSNHNVSYCELENIEEYGILMISGANNIIYHNTIDTNHEGINLQLPSNNNEIRDNTITKSSQTGIDIIRSSNNHIYHNHFVNNYQSASDTGSNFWDNGYPSGGNYWDDYQGQDANHDGIGDTPYNIPGGSNQDTYPLGYFAGQNQPPTATIDSISPNPATEGQTVSFSGSGIDNDGYIAGYSWREGTTTLSTSQSFSKSDFSVGTHTIYFKVIDDDGAWSSEVSATLVVNQDLSDGSPTADAGGPYSGYVNVSITFDGSKSTDDGTIVSYKWNFGDGTTAIGISITHAYTITGNYTVTLTVTDNGGKTDTDTTYANVSAQATDNGEKNKTPGFEIIIIAAALTLVIIFKKPKKDF